MFNKLASRVGVFLEKRVTPGVVAAYYLHRGRAHVGPIDPPPAREGRPSSPRPGDVPGATRHRCRDNRVIAGGAGPSPRSEGIAPIPTCSVPRAVLVLARPVSPSPSRAAGSGWAPPLTGRMAAPSPRPAPAGASSISARRTSRSPTGSSGSAPTATPGSTGCSRSSCRDPPRPARRWRGHRRHPRASARLLWFYTPERAGPASYSPTDTWGENESHAQAPNPDPPSRSRRAVAADFDVELVGT